jgi:FkbM family methyltransferase
MRVPIFAGPLRGSWWLLQSPGQPGRVLSGTYEPRHTGLFRQWVQRGATVLDIGAHAGYYTLLGSALAGPGGTVWAFEPEPRNCRYLRRHVTINHRTNVRVEEIAISDSAGWAPFRFGKGSGTGMLDEAGDIRVRTNSLDSLCESRSIAPSLIKIDAESAEVRVLLGAARTLAEHRPVLLLSTHSEELHLECLHLLESAGYRTEPITGPDALRTSELLCLPVERRDRAPP